MTTKHSPQYKIESTGNGAFFTITCTENHIHENGDTVFLQGDDANQFSAELDATNDFWDFDAVCEKYFPN
jgi:hypothetical protein